MNAPLRLHVLSAASEPGGTAPNEDRYGFDLDTGVAWVLDAATSTAPPRISPDQTDGAWFADQINDALHELATQKPALSPAELIDQAALRAREALIGLGHDPEDRPPYASIAVIRLEGETLHWALLGDVVLGVQHPDGATEVLRDDRSEPFVQMAIDLSYRFTGEELRAEQRAFEARYVNTPAGYPILSTMTDSLDAALRGAVPIESGERILITTDGLARLLDPFRQPADFLDLIRSPTESPNVRTVIRHLRAIEQADEKRELYRRIKVSDDATGLLITLD